MTRKKKFIKIPFKKRVFYSTVTDFRFRHHVKSVYHSAFKGLLFCSKPFVTLLSKVCCSTISKTAFSYFHLKYSVTVFISKRTYCNWRKYYKRLESFTQNPNIKFWTIFLFYKLNHLSAICFEREGIEKIF